MPSSYKNFQPEDIASTKNALHELIPLPGSLLKSATFTNNNIKNFSHGKFQKVYDYHYLSSSANDIMDLSWGYSFTDANSDGIDDGDPNSNLDSYALSANIQNDKKKQMYVELSKVLVGHDENGEILKFDANGDLTEGLKHHNCLFINFSRTMVKDEIQKGTFTMDLAVDETIAIAQTTPQHIVTIADTGASSNFRSNSPAGDYGILYATDSITTTDPCVKAGGPHPVGLIYYQAGILVLSASVFLQDSTNADGILADANFTADPDMNVVTTGENVETTLKTRTIVDACDGIRERVVSLRFNNTVDINSTIYFCRVNHNEFNYSSNPTYLEDSRIRVKNNAFDEPVVYFTTVNLYSPDNELMAVAKLSEPLKKSPSEDYTLRVRLDY